MISNFEPLDELFNVLNKVLGEKVHFYVIGGAVMLYHGLKVATKDIDIVVDSKKEFLETEKALKKTEFTTKLPSTEYKKFDLNQIFIKEGFRIDLFQRTVCSGFILSEGMKKRAQKVRDLEHLTVSLCSTTDIFLFKTFTEREGDIADCISLTRSAIDWDMMLDEIDKQMKISGNKVWITYIGERMDLLLERGVRIPIIGKIDRLREEYFAEAEKRLTTKN
ncbi:nucleotidyltransferase [Candidatus Woesearchaeota archaeon]|nr:nucleotidyltransferase [Candidatus Woesearchaeota archaeon]